MNDAGKYILSVGVAAMLAGILNGLTDEKSSLGAMTRMVCGLFLAFTVISPFHDLNMTYITSFAQSFDEAAAASVSYGESIADQAVRDIIKQETEAYILDKAGLYQLKLDVEVELGDCEPVPASVRITGPASPYARTQLQKTITDELGIPKERQQWIG